MAVEHGGFGSTTAAPIARKIMDAWILGKMPVPPPPPPGEAGAAPPIAFDAVEGAINGVEAFGEVEASAESAPAEAPR